MTIRRSALAALFALPLVLTACGNDDEAPASTTSSTTSTTSSTVSSTTSSTEPTSDAAPAPTAAQEPAPEPEQPQVSYTCPDWHLYQLGTTFYADGTSGYTADCHAQMQAQMDIDGPVHYPEYTGPDDAGEFVPADPNYTPPPFNPDSADGYGPGVDLPPFCYRFPTDPSC